MEPGLHSVCGVGSPFELITSYLAASVLTPEPFASPCGLQYNTFFLLPSFLLSWGSVSGRPGIGCVPQAAFTTSPALARLVLTATPNLVFSLLGLDRFLLCSSGWPPKQEV